MKKHIIYYLLIAAIVLMLVLSFAACSDDSSDKSSDVRETREPRESSQGTVETDEPKESKEPENTPSPEDLETPDVYEIVGYWSKPDVTGSPLYHFDSSGTLRVYNQTDGKPIVTYKYEWSTLEHQGLIHADENILSLGFDGENPVLTGADGVSSSLGRYDTSAAEAIVNAGKLLHETPPSPPATINPNQGHAGYYDGYLESNDYWNYYYEKYGFFPNWYYYDYYPYYYYPYYYYPYYYYPYYYYGYGDYFYY